MIEQGPSGPTRSSVPGDALYAAERLARAAWAFSTRRVRRDETFRIRHEPGAPSSGDLVLARVDVLGHHRGLQLATGRRKNMFPGDEIVVAYGDRYAPSQFEAVVPKTLGPCALVAGGGVAAKALTWNARITKGPTLITPIGLLVDAAGERVNLRDYAIDPVNGFLQPCPPTLAVVGTAMDAGKTETAAFLVKGLTRAGVRVGFAKITGTGAGGDTWLLKDAGADPVFDFTDAGFVSTYRVALEDIERVLVTLMAHLTKSGVDAVVLEIADGVLQQETAALLDSPVFKDIVGGVLFTARDSMGAVAGTHWLNERHIAIAGLSGVMTSAPLQSQEASIATGLPTFTREDLATERVALKILAWTDDQKLIHGEADACAESSRDEAGLVPAEETTVAARASGGPGDGVSRLRSQLGGP